MCEKSVKMERNGFGIYLNPKFPYSRHLFWPLCTEGPLVVASCHCKTKSEYVSKILEKWPLSGCLKGCHIPSIAGILVEFIVPQLIIRLPPFQKPSL